MDINNILIKNERLINYFLIFCLIFYPFVFIWQCGDLTDTGFAAYCYNSFFNNLEIGKIFSPVFLNDLIGATWFKMFPNLGIIGLKLLYLLFLYPIIYVIFVVLKMVAKNKTLILFSLVCGIVFTERCFNFNYTKDISCWFFLLLSGLFLIKGIEEKTHKPIFFSGLILFLACLCRFPSFLAVIICPIILFYKIYYKEEKNAREQFKFLIKTYSFFLIGFIFSLIIFLFILNFCNLFDVFFNNLYDINGLSQSSYSPLPLLIKIAKEFLFFIPCAIAVISVLILGSLIYKHSIKQNRLNYFFIYIILVLYLTTHLDDDFTYTNKIMYLVPAFCLLPLMYSLIHKDQFSSFVLVYLALMISQVFGTNTGFFLKLLYGLMVLFPLSILILAHYKVMAFKKISFLTLPFSITGIFVIVFISVLVRLSWIYHVSYGVRNRISARYVVNNPKMKGILTTYENALHIENLCDAINSSIKSDNSLFIFGHQPMFYYLINREPAIDNFWMSDNMQQADELFIKINESIIKTKKWPLIVDTKNSVLLEAGDKNLEKFLRKNNYICKINKPDFNIWVKD